MYSLWIVQRDFTRWDHLENPGRVSGSGLVSGLVWVDYMDPVWIITVAPFVSYNIIQFIDHCLV